MNLFPKRELSGGNIYHFAKLLKIPNFRGVFMLNGLPKGGALRNERAVVNLDRTGNGTHWVAFCKKGGLVIYFDSFGNLRPPSELIVYWSADTIFYNYKRVQSFRSAQCGGLCLRFLTRCLH